VITGYRASVNRTNDADYVLYDDLGGIQKKSVNQQVGTGCTKSTIGIAHCNAGEPAGWCSTATTARATRPT